MIQYPDSEMEIETFDHVEVTLDYGVFEGQITKIMPTRNTVRVKFRDTIYTRRDGEPRHRSIQVNKKWVELVRRDG